MNERHQNLFDTLNLMSLTLKELGPQAIEKHIDAPDESWILRRVENFSRRLIADIYRFHIACDLNAELFSRTFFLLGPQDKVRLSIEDQESHQIICKHFMSVFNGMNYSIASALAATALPLADYSSNSESLINSSGKRIVEIWYNQDPTLQRFSFVPAIIKQASDDLKKIRKTDFGMLKLLIMDEADLQNFLKTISIGQLEALIQGLDSTDKYESALINLLLSKLSKEQMITTFMNTQVFGRLTAESKEAAQSLWSRMPQAA